MDMENLCLNCGEEVRTTEIEGTIHVNGLYACYRGIKMTDPRWELVAAESVDESSEDGDWAVSEEQSRWIGEPSEI